MSVSPKYLIASIALSLCAVSPLALAQTKNNETAGAPSPNVERSKLTSEERAAARKERRAKGSEVAKEDLKNPVNNQTGNSQMSPSAKSTTKDERAAARKERVATGSDVAKENAKNPVNNETGKPSK